MLSNDQIKHKSLPPLVGLHSFSEAMSCGLTVAESVNRLKRFHWLAKRLSLIFTSRITAMPVYELKMAFGLHAHYLAEHAEPFFNRVREMREPPYGMDVTPHEALDILLDEIQCAPDESFLYGIYEIIIPAMVAALKNHIDESNRLFDHPTYRVCRFALLEYEEILAYGKEVVRVMVDADFSSKNAGWLHLLETCLKAMG